MLGDPVASAFAAVTRPPRPPNSDWSLGLSWSEVLQVGLGFEYTATGLRGVWAEGDRFRGAAAGGEVGRWVVERVEAAAGVFRLIRSSRSGRFRWK